MVEDENVASLSKNLLQMKFMRRVDTNNKIISNLNTKKDEIFNPHNVLLKSIPREDHWYLSVAIPNYVPLDENIVFCDDFKFYDEMNTFGRFSINGYNADIQKFADYHNKGISNDIITSTDANVNGGNRVEDISDGEMASRMRSYTNKNRNQNKSNKAHKTKRNRKRKVKGGKN